MYFIYFFIDIYVYMCSESINLSFSHEYFSDTDSENHGNNGYDSEWEDVEYEALRF